MISSPTLQPGSGVDAEWFLSGQVHDDSIVRELPLTPLPFTVGRLHNHALCLPRGTVSGRHAEFRMEGESLVLRDLDSTNGTFVNGQRIRGEVVVCQHDLIHFADQAFRVRRGDVRKAGMETVNKDVSDDALMLVRFDVLMSERAFEPYYQPIINLSDESLIGLEALGRSGIFGLESPGAMFQAASHLCMEAELSRGLRFKALEVSRSLAQPPPHLFINTHPAELDERELFASLRRLRDISPSQPITLEIHEQACTSHSLMKQLRSELADLRISMAYDDFGAGQARLRELIEIPPDYLKFDMGLVRGIDQRPASHRQMVGILVQMVRELNISAVAEGIENEMEAIVCRELGFDCAQGYFFGRPVPASRVQLD